MLCKENAGNKRDRERQLSSGISKDYKQCRINVVGVCNENPVFLLYEINVKFHTT